MASEHHDPVAYLRNALAALRQGGIVLHPTGGLYGLAADPRETAALKKLAELKQLPTSNRPFVLLVKPGWLDTLCDRKRLSKTANAALDQLVSAFWPGGLTLVVPATQSVPATVCRNQDNLSTVAIRADDHPVAQDLVSNWGTPLLTTSANISGSPAPSALSDVTQTLREASTLVDGSPRPDGMPSTVLSLCAQSPQLLRPGRISQERLDTVLCTIQPPPTD